MDVILIEISAHLNGCDQLTLTDYTATSRTLTVTRWGSYFIAIYRTRMAQWFDGTEHVIVTTTPFFILGEGHIYCRGEDTVYNHSRESQTASETELGKLLEYAHGIRPKLPRGFRSATSDEVVRLIQDIRNWTGPRRQYGAS